MTPVAPVEPSNEHVVEVRYKPNSRVLDNRGRWAAKLSEELQLPHWKIEPNRLDVMEANKRRSCFVSFRNLGFQAADTPTRNYFVDQTSKFFKVLFDLGEFPKSLHVERFGVRSKFCVPYGGSFEDLVTRYTTRYVVPTEAAREAIGPGAKLVDVAGPLNFIDEIGNFNTMGGPVRQAEAAGLFAKDAGFPDVGLFYDIDYWTRPDHSLAFHDLTKLLTGFAVAAWDRHERVVKLIAGD